MRRPSLGAALFASAAASALPAAAGPATATVQVFLPRGEKLVSVDRPGTTAQDAMKALLRGPTLGTTRLTADVAALPVLR